MRNFIVKSFPHFREEQFDDCRFPLLEQILLLADKQHDLSENLSSQDLVKKALYTINNMLSKGAIIPHELENIKTNILIDSETTIEAYAQSLGSTMSEAVGGGPKSYQIYLQKNLSNTRFLVLGAVAVRLKPS